MAFITSDYFLVNRAGTDFKVQYSDLEASIVGAVVTPGNGTISITEFDGTKVGEFTVNQSGDASIALPQVVIPESLHPKGFINVANAAPANPVHGDIYVQTSSGAGSVNSDVSFAPGINGVVEEGVFVIYGVDDQWHAGGQANPTEVQADYAQVDTTARDYIKNKPDIQGLIDSSLQDSSKVGDGTLTLKNADGSTAGSFSANQAADETIQLPAGFSGKYSDLIAIPTEFTPEAHTHDYNSLVNKPTIGEGVLTINQDGKKVGEFTANQTGNVTIELVDTDTNIDAYTKVQSDARFLAKNIATLPLLS